MRKILVVLALAFAGCATTSGAGDTVPPQGTPVRIVEKPAPDLAREPVFDAKVEAHGFDHAADCEVRARELKASNPDRGWKLLRACIDRGDFTELRLLLDGPWDADLRTRPDAGELLTRIIAARGGDIDGDLALLHEHKVPVFSLSAAVDQPQVYAGRLVMVRARVSDLRSTGGHVTVELDEYSHSSDVVYAPVGRGRQLTRDVRHSDHDPAGAQHGTVSERDRENVIDRRTTTDDVATGRQALGKMAQADPFFEPNKDFVVLARFDGVRESSDASDDPMAVVTVLHYFRPAALALY